ncbi:phage tail protein [Pontimicrobium sp. IMCC45349]|uniref:phage tail protein n=1 Tax=Pontimicrobium sp. IMCC45349 TaxID=3391574 RepID=UPI0039A32507
MSTSDKVYPPVGFYFQVTIENETYSFKEVSGISSEVSTEEITEGGENRFKYKVPTHVKYSNLELKRGIIRNNSKLKSWVTKTLEVGLSSTITPKTIVVSLLNEEGSIVMSWTFVNAWPVSWNVSSLNSMTNETLIESLSFSYNYFTTKIIQ